MVGPCRDAAEAASLLADGPPDCAIVDINLGGGPDFGAARTLLAAGVRIVFVTGYEHSVFPGDLAHLPRLEKPADGGKIVAAVAQVSGR